MISTKLREGTCKIVKAAIEAVAWVNIVEKKRCDLTHCDHVSAFIIAGVDWFAVYLNLWLSLCILPCSYPLERKYSWLPELFSLPPFHFAVSYDIVLKCLLLMTYVCLCLCMFFLFTCNLLEPLCLQPSPISLWPCGSQATLNQL